MRVLIVSPTLGLGGAERLSLQYAEGLGARGHDVLIVFGNHCRWDEFLRAHEIRAIRIADRLLSPRSLREWVPALRRAIAEFAPDVVFAQSITASLAARAAAPRCRLVTMLHGLPEKGGLPGLTLRAARSSALAVSDQTAADIARHHWAPAVEVVRSGVDVAALERAAEGPSPELPAGGPRFVAVARLTRTKRIDLLIDAFAIVLGELPGAVLAIAGVGPITGLVRALEEREAQAARLGIADRVAFLGHVDPIAPLIRACDALVITSDSEGLPMALLESMALGVPAVARPVGGVPLVVHDGETGWLTDDGTPRAIAGSMLAAIASPDERARRGAAGRELVLRDYTADRALDRIDAALRTTAGALPLRPRPYNAAVRLAERRRIRRARPGGAEPVPGVRVLAYHRVADAPGDPLAVTPGEFASHLEAIERSGAEVVTLRRAAELVRAGGGGGSFVALSFDDGYLDTAEVALPLLERRGFGATVFVVTGVLDGLSGFYWYRRDPPPALGWGDIDALVRHGSIEVQSHGRTHAALPALDDGAVRDEIEGSRRALAARVPYEVWAFSYPAGRSSPRDRAAVAAAGYTAGFGTRPGIDAHGGDPLDLRRTVIRPGLSGSDVRAVLAGAIDRDTWLRAKAHARRSRMA